MYSSLILVVFALTASHCNARYATCFMQHDPASTQMVNGTVTFHQESAESELHVTVDLKGFTPVPCTAEPDARLHGFHVHTYGDISTGCGSTGGHFNPEGVKHGGPQDAVRHHGDFGNKAQADDGSMFLTFTDPLASLFGDHSIVGRAIVVHSGKDDLGQGGDAGSLASGNAGSRVACCVIGLSKRPE